MTLNEIGLKHGTDKASHHHYLPLYDLLFERLRFEPIWLLEIGTQFGNSLRTWREYFPNATIHGIDVVDNGAQVEGTSLFIGNAYDHRIRPSKDYDIIIDDGSHTEEDQLFFVFNYAPICTRLLIVEDVLLADTIPKLAATLPEGWQYTAVEMCEGKSQVDSRLFIAWPID